ncbi:doxx family protein [Winogradskyella sp. A2]|uniref:doxx family protein n=1 Tax=Winogradskyella sp. A2 TaxID=3366944 RepID=UPI00398C33C1
MKRQISLVYILAISIGIIYLWFGMLKFFPNVSPAEELAKNTIDLLTFHLIPSNISIILLATWESLVGLFLILNIWRRTTVVIAIIHIIFTFSPIFLLTEQVFSDTPFQLSLVGQYIIKNLIIIVCLFLLYRAPANKFKLQ